MEKSCRRMATRVKAGKGNFAENSQKGPSAFELWASRLAPNSQRPQHHDQRLQRYRSMASIQRLLMDPTLFVCNM
jgi:hypothetical protein